MVAIDLSNDGGERKGIWIYLVRHDRDQPLPRGQERGNSRPVVYWLFRLSHLKHFRYLVVYGLSFLCPKDPYVLTSCADGNQVLYVLAWKLPHSVVILPTQLTSFYAQISLKLSYVIDVRVEAEGNLEYSWEIWNIHPAWWTLSPSE